VTYANTGALYLPGYVGSGSPFEAAVMNQILRYYNFSYHHGSIQSETAVSGSPVPEISLMYGNTKPSWWPAGKAFDQFGPDLTTLGMNPAESRYVYGDYSGMLDDGSGGGGGGGSSAGASGAITGQAVLTGRFSLQ
jgi:hypothetical protein